MRSRVSSLATEKTSCTACSHLSPLSPTVSKKKEPISGTFTVTASLSWPRRHFFILTTPPLLYRLPLPNKFAFLGIGLATSSRWFPNSFVPSLIHRTTCRATVASISSESWRLRSSASLSQMTLASLRLATTRGRARVTASVVATATVRVVGRTAASWANTAAAVPRQIVATLRVRRRHPDAIHQLISGVSAGVLRRRVGVRFLSRWPAESWTENTRGTHGGVLVRNHRMVHSEAARC
jgi:hypothetical protein